MIDAYCLLLTVTGGDESLVNKSLFKGGIYDEAVILLFVEVDEM